MGEEENFEAERAPVIEPAVEPVFAPPRPPDLVPQVDVAPPVGIVEPVVAPPRTDDTPDRTQMPEVEPVVAPPRIEETPEPLFRPEREDEGISLRDRPPIEAIEAINGDQPPIPADILPQPDKWNDARAAEEEAMRRESLEQPPLESVTDVPSSVVETVDGRDPVADATIENGEPGGSTLQEQIPAIGSDIVETIGGNDSVNATTPLDTGMPQMAEARLEDVAGSDEATLPPLDTVAESGISTVADAPATSEPSFDDIADTVIGTSIDDGTPLVDRDLPAGEQLASLEAAAAGQSNAIPDMVEESTLPPEAGPATTRNESIASETEATSSDIPLDLGDQPGDQLGSQAEVSEAADEALTVPVSPSAQEPIAEDAGETQLDEQPAAPTSVVTTDLLAEQSELEAQGTRDPDSTGVVEDTIDTGSAVTPGEAEEVPETEQPIPGAQTQFAELLPQNVDTEPQMASTPAESTVETTATEDAELREADSSSALEASVLSSPEAIPANELDEQPLLAEQPQIPVEKESALKPATVAQNAEVPGEEELTEDTTTGTENDVVSPSDVFPESPSQPVTEELRPVDSLSSEPKVESVDDISPPVDREELESSQISHESQPPIDGTVSAQENSQQPDRPEELRGAADADQTLETFEERDEVVEMTPPLDTSSQAATTSTSEVTGGDLETVANEDGLESLADLPQDGLPPAPRFQSEKAEETALTGSVDDELGSDLDTGTQSETLDAGTLVDTETAADTVQEVDTVLDGQDSTAPAHDAAIEAPEPKDSTEVATEGIENLESDSTENSDKTEDTVGNDVVEAEETTETPEAVGTAENISESEGSAAENTEGEKAADGEPSPEKEQREKEELEQKEKDQRLFEEEQLKEKDRLEAEARDKEQRDAAEALRKQQEAARLAELDEAKPVENVANVVEVPPVDSKPDSILAEPIPDKPPSPAIELTEQVNDTSESMPAVAEAPAPLEGNELAALGKEGLVDAATALLAEINSMSASSTGPAPLAASGQGGHQTSIPVAPPPGETRFERVVYADGTARMQPDRAQEGWMRERDDALARLAKKQVLPDDKTPGQLIDEIDGQVFKAAQSFLFENAPERGGWGAEEVAKGIVFDHTGLNVRAVQNRSNQGADGIAYDDNDKKIFLVEVKYSKNGVSKARAPSSVDPGERILSWSAERREKLNSWKAVFAQTPEQLDELDKAIKAGYEVVGVHVRVGPSKAEPGAGPDQHPGYDVRVDRWH